MRGLRRRRRTGIARRARLARGHIRSEPRSSQPGLSSRILSNLKTLLDTGETFPPFRSRLFVRDLSRAMMNDRTTRAAAALTAILVLKVVGSLHRLLYRYSGGRVGGTLRGGPVLLLTTTGRKTGQDRTWPLSYVASGDELLIVASAGGAPRHPAWYLNLRAQPRVSIRLGGKTRAMLARSAEGTERPQLWERFAGRYPVAAGYQRKAGREIPLVPLHPAAPADGRRADPRLLRRGEEVALIGAGAKASETRTAEATNSTVKNDGGLCSIRRIAGRSDRS